MYCSLLVVGFLPSSLPSIWFGIGKWSSFFFHVLYFLVILVSYFTVIGGRGLLLEVV